MLHTVFAYTILEFNGLSAGTSALIDSRSHAMS